MPKTSSSKRKTTPKKRTASPKAKKPKVILAKNKVAALCGLICGICVLAIGVNIFISTESSEVKEPLQQSVAVTQTQSQKSVSQPEKSVETPQKPVVQKPKSTEVQKKQISQPEKTVNQTKNQISQTEKISSQPQTSKTVVQSDSKKVASATPPSQQEQIQQNIPKNRFNIPPAAKGATVVIVIDDAGMSVENTKRYASLPFPITIAVLPKLPQSRACADAVRALGKEVILHQPMQSLNHNLNPGPGKITSEMSTYEIAAILKENLLEIGPVKGMNNHEGSDVTSNEIKIGAVLEVCSEMGVYFLDSRTTSATKAPQAALERDMHIFEKAGPYLDNDIDRAKMLERIRETLAYANQHGRAIVIGHVDKSVKILPDLLREMYPEMKAAGYRFATPSMLR